MVIAKSTLSNGLLLPCTPHLCRERVIHLYPGISLNWINLQLTNGVYCCSPLRLGSQTSMNKILSNGTSELFPSLHILPKMVPQPHLTPATCKALVKSQLVGTARPGTLTPVRTPVFHLISADHTGLSSSDHTGLPVGTQVLCTCRSSAGTALHQASWWVGPSVLCRNSIHHTLVRDTLTLYVSKLHPATLVCVSIPILLTPFPLSLPTPSGGWCLYLPL